MQSEAIEAVIYYRHTAKEIAALEAATLPLHDAIRVVASKSERTSLKRIVSCKYFRASQAEATKNMLLRAAKYARGNLDGYFPWMRTDLIAAAEQLEIVAAQYWMDFQSLRQTTVPTP
jgi:hypothetical protein